VNPDKQTNDPLGSLEEWEDFLKARYPEGAPNPEAIEKPFLATVQVRFALCALQTSFAPIPGAWR
jgi:hypothetical protein